eukprot:COSAG01_NODE_3769_length_5716_cov_10.341641_2_plen_77_part_00
MFCDADTDTYVTKQVVGASGGEPPAHTAAEPPRGGRGDQGTNEPPCVAVRASCLHTLRVGARVVVVPPPPPTLYIV